MTNQEQEFGKGIVVNYIVKSKENYYPSILRKNGRLMSSAVKSDKIGDQPKIYKSQILAEKAASKYGDRFMAVAI